MIKYNYDDKPKIIILPDIFLRPPGPAYISFTVTLYSAPARPRADASNNKVERRGCYHPCKKHKMAKKKTLNIGCPTLRGVCLIFLTVTLYSASARLWADAKMTKT